MKGKKKFIVDIGQVTSSTEPSAQATHSNAMVTCYGLVNDNPGHSVP